MKNFAILASLVVPFLLPSALGAQCSFSPPISTSLGSGQDFVAVVALPFPFSFAGNSYSTITISSNGFVWLGMPGNGARCCQGNGTQFQNDPASIAILWTELVVAGLYFDIDPSQTMVRVTWSGAHEAGLTAPTFDLQMTLDASGSVSLWYGPNVTVSNHVSVVGVSGGMVGTAVDYSTSAPFSSTTATVYQQFLAGTVNTAGHALSFLPTGPASWYVSSCLPRPHHCAAFVFDRSTTMMTTVRTSTNRTRAVDAATAADTPLVGDVAWYFTAHPGGRALIFTFDGNGVTQVGSIYGSATPANTAISGFPTATPPAGKPIAQALCAASTALVALEPTAPTNWREIYLYCDNDGPDTSPPSSCRGTLPSDSTGNHCAQFVGAGLAFASGTWQDALCALLYAQITMQAYLWDDFVDDVGQRVFLSAVCDLTGGTMTRVWDSSTGPVVNPWRVSGDGCRDFHGFRLSMTHDGIPQIGQTIQIGCRTSSPFPFFQGVGFSNTNLGSSALPFDLAPLGAPGCSIYTSWDMTDGIFGFQAMHAISIPNAPFLAGITLYYQGIHLHVLNNALGLVSSNLLQVTISL